MQHIGQAELPAASAQRSGTACRRGLSDSADEIYSLLENAAAPAQRLRLSADA